MKKLIGIVLVLFLFGLLWHFREPKTPCALQQHLFDESLGIKELGNKFLFEKKEDLLLRNVAKRLIRKRGEEYEKKEVQKIPLVIHEVWPLDAPLPDSCLRAIQSVKQMNPEYTHILWTKERFLPLVEKYFGKCWKKESPEVVRDLAAASILFEKGGIIVDVESECVQSFSAISPLASCIVGFEPPLSKSVFNKKLFLSPSCLLAVSHHPFIEKWITIMKERLLESKGRGSSLWISQESLTFVGREFGDECPGALFLGPSYFCPIRPENIKAFQKLLDGEAKKKIGEKIRDTLHLSGAPLFATLSRETILVHMSGGRLSKESIFKSNK